jgi:isovaleryl-CoA dehydrogenase
MKRAIFRNLNVRSRILFKSIHEGTISLFNPTDLHQSLRNMVRHFVESEVEPQAIEFNKHEKFNADLFRKLGDLGLLGITVDPEYGGSGMDAVAAVIVHGNY